MRFIIRDLLWLMVVVGLGTGWWTQRHDMLAEQSLLMAERDSAQGENRRLTEVNKIVGDDFKFIMDSLGRLGIDPAHIVSASRVAGRYGHRHFDVLIERRHPVEIGSGQDTIF
jgi:hypothetical protein